MNGDSISHYVDYKLGVTKDLKGCAGPGGRGRDQGQLAADQVRPSVGTFGAVFSVARSF